MGRNKAGVKVQRAFGKAFGIIPSSLPEVMVRLLDGRMALAEGAAWLRDEGYSEHEVDLLLTWYKVNLELKEYLHA